MTELLLVARNDTAELHILPEQIKGTLPYSDE
jgi:hypothetical protein